MTDLRIGYGYDVHRLVSGRALVLGGVTVPFEKGLLGHSDADVLTHAVMDALLGAAALGDIGKLFPDSDARYAGADSTALLRQVTAVLGFNRASEIFLAEEFRALGAEIILATADGSAGLRGLVTDGMAAVSDSTYLYTCGPELMLKAVYGACTTSGQFSFEERMGCGFGACMGCSCKTKYGNKRICKDGPVLEKEEIIW